MFQKVTTEQEIRELVTLAQVIWAEHYSAMIGMDQVEYMLNKFHSKETISKQVFQDHYYFFLIKKDNRSVGYIGLQIKENELFLSKIYILSSERGNGLGRASIKLIKQLAQENNLGKISLTVNKNNTESIAAYYKFGFIKTGEICVDIGAGYQMDDYQMELIV